jgi:sterol desaturase/sphingolipid hydroxylase (fatty acid hydroxylase superfamily)
MLLMSWGLVAAPAGGFVFAFLLGSFVEYATHRLMHLRRLLGTRHLNHHKKGDGQGVWGEFVDYFLFSLLFIWLGFLVSKPVGIAYAVGVALYSFLAAWAHQLNHERPELVFWMPRPVHYLHHRYNMWRANFGILVDFWDRLLGTYEAVEWKPERRAFDYPLRAFFEIGWFRRGGAIIPASRAQAGPATPAPAADRPPGETPPSLLPAS